ncbi:Basal-body rod modification protein FlgD [Rubripirellula obstinata]|uniref:Basal-body rod modification protein FlgD n=1 Tax=Rubripirellula obstinata TaxID=406547 RepID=A0A5B1CL12_9BACT|nr:flagellar hook capping FlgD N-terminal domain-containing protein [Rubripirellula obstinata]KAA1260220.1 Basal-body rod modification protein FlgD [Rubripirellula obstinata]
MSAIGQATSANFSAQEAAQQAGGASDAFGDVDLDGFLQLMISELQNQDPLSPMDNSQMVAQMGQIREIGATDKLTSTLDGLASSQELVTASTLIGQNVTGLANDASAVDGVVDRITVETDAENGSRSIKVHVAGKTMDINNIREIQPG